MNALCLCRMGELCAAVRLDLFRSIAEVDDRPFYEVYGGITALLLVCVYETFARGFFYDRILVVLQRLFCGKASRGHIFYVKLPLLAQDRGSLVFPVVFRFLLCVLALFPIPQSNEHTVAFSSRSLPYSSHTEMLGFRLR